MEKNIEIIIICLLFSISKTNDDINTELETIKKRIEKYIDKSHIPGNSLILLKKDDGDTIHKLYGHYGTDNSNLLAYGIGSLSKSFTGMAIRILEYENKINLQDKLNNYVDVAKYFKDKVKAKQTTLFELLTHTSGLQRDSPPDKKFSFPFKKGEFNYSNIGFALLGKVIEKVTGIKYGDFIKEKIFTVLNLKNSDISYKQSKKNKDVHLIKAYQIEWGNQVKKTETDYEREFYLPAYGLTLSNEDMSKYLEIYLKLGIGALTQDIIQPMLSDLITVEKDVGYGYGIGSIVYNKNDIKYKIYTHTGSVPGYSTAIAICPELNLAGAILTNNNDFIFNPSLFLLENFPKMLVGFDEIITDTYTVKVVFYDLFSFICLVGGLFLIAYKIYKIIKNKDDLEETKIKFIICLILNIAAHFILPTVFLIIIIYVLSMGFEFSFLYPYAPSLFVDFFVFIPIFYIGGLIKIGFYLYKKILLKSNSKDIDNQKQEIYQEEAGEVVVVSPSDEKISN